MNHIHPTAQIILLWAACLLGVSFGSGCQHAADAGIGNVKPLQPAAGVVPVQVVRTASGYQLLRAGRPYQIKGAAGVQHFDLVREKGGNSVRLYTTDYADVLLDEAQRQGLTVTLGLWMKPSYEKFDYYDPKAIEEQKQAVYRQVQRYKNHPALLMWNLGNELDNHARDFKAYQIVNETAQMIHQLDPNHPVTTSITDAIYFVPVISKLCPEINLLTINVFDKMASMPKGLAYVGWTGPYVIGEFGGRGWWESLETAWGAPLDQSGSAKAEFIRHGYETTVVGQSAHCLGSYVLYWGNRFEQTDMWLSMFAPTGEKTPLVDAIQFLWTGQKAVNQAPSVGAIRLAGKFDIDNVVLQPNTDYPASISAIDPDGDSLRLRWKITRDVNEFHTLPQNRTAPEVIASAIRRSAGQTALVHTPAAWGPYRLLVDVFDGKGSVTSDSFPFFVGKPDHPELGIHMRVND